MSTYENHKMAGSRLPFIFHNSWHIRPNVPRFYANWHENIEILLITEGSGTSFLNGSKYPLSPGDIVVINSNVIHATSTASQAIKYHCLIIDRQFCLSNFVDTNTVWFDEHFRDSEIGWAISSLTKTFHKDPKQTSDVLAIRSAVLSILARLCSHHCNELNTSHSETHSLACIRRAISFIQAEYTRDLSLDEVCKFAGLSKYYFAHEFQRITKCSFVKYINNLRCERAKELLLSSGLPLADIAINCGFQSRAYFSRTFTKYMNITPSEYRKKQHS